ncbi:MAG: hypothetical protein ACYS8L_02515 [Planctomycetota bacterium]|jgi:chromosome segregation ATPase
MTGTSAEASVTPQPPGGEDTLEQLEARLEQLERDWAKVRRTARETGRAADAGFRDVKAQIDASIRAANEKLSEAEREAGRGWDDAMDSLQTAIDGAEKAYRDALSRFEWY